MSWSDDIRCLHCDGRLPLYRKITHGQFCSSAHRNQYWQEQERLAMERLHETHNSLQAYVPPPPQHQVELAPEPEPTFAPDPLIAGHVPASAWTHPDLTPGLVASDPLEYDLEVAPRHPASAASPSFSGRLQVAGLVHAPGVPTPLVTLAEAISAFSIPYGNESAPASVILLQPQGSAHMDRAPAAAGALGIPIESPLASRLVLGAAPWVSHETTEPLATQQRQAQYASLTLPAVSGVLDRMLDQLPRPERLFALRQFALRPLLATGPTVAWTTALPTLAKRPVQTVLAFEPAALVVAGAGRLPFEPRSTARANSTAILQAPPLEVALRPELSECLSESKEVGTLARAQQGTSSESLHTPLRPVVNPDQRLPLASGVLYSVRPRIAALKSTPQAPRLSFAQASRSAELPPLLLEVGDVPGSWMPPPQEIPLGKAASSAPTAGGPVKVLVLPQPLRTLALLPASKLEPANPAPVRETLAAPPPVVNLPKAEAPAASIVTPPVMQSKPVEGTLVIEPWWAHATGFWKHGPRDLKMLLLGIPLLIALALHPRLPKVHLTSGQSGQGISQAFHTQLASFRHSMAERAAVALDEDFRSGLDDWNSRSGDATGWSYDATGFVKPGPLALYSPSATLTDYQVQFLGMIGKKSLSWVVRAQNFDNYYVVKLVERKGGPLPQIGLTRYAVIDGKAQDRVDTVVAISARPEMMYLVRMDVKGDDFSLLVQDQMVDSWTEPRLPRGGIGFYSAKGEESLLRWVQITHQYDMLGRLCAYLAPNNFAN